LLFISYYISFLSYWLFHHWYCHYMMLFVITSLLFIDYFLILLLADYIEYSYYDDLHYHWWLLAAITDYFQILPVIVISFWYYFPLLIHITTTDIAIHIIIDIDTVINYHYAFHYTLALYYAIIFIDTDWYFHWYCHNIDITSLLMLFAIDADIAAVSRHYFATLSYVFTLLLHWYYSLRYFHYWSY